jgi:hypothetical protein
MEKRPEDIINDMIKIEGVDTNKISDGYHTFGELYEHRIELFIALVYCADEYLLGRLGGAWRSKKHDDGSEWDGWFIMGIGADEGKQITYHLPNKYWDRCDFVETLERAPKWDGHSSDDVLERLRKI